MKAFQIIIDFITSFIIAAGGAYSVALVVAKGTPLSGEAIALVVATGLITAAKGTRALIALPPLSNGNYDAIAELVKSKKGDTTTIHKP